MNLLISFPYRMHGTATFVSQNLGEDLVCNSYLVFCLTFKLCSLRIYFNIYLRYVYVDNEL